MNENRPSDDGAVARTDRTTVFFDGSCPICRAEIGFMERRDRDGRLSFADVADPSTPLPPGLDRDSAMRRFHVRGADGEMRDGAAAFAAMWREVPLFRPLGRLASLPGMVPLLDRLYSGFLRVRPRLQPLFARLERGR